MKTVKYYSFLAKTEDRRQFTFIARNMKHAIKKAKESAHTINGNFGEKKVKILSVKKK